MTECINTWYQDFYNMNSMMIINNDKYNNLLKISKNQHIQLSIHDKVAQIEVDFQAKLKDIENLYNNKSSIDEIKKQNSLKILQKELDIIKLLTKYSLQSKQLDYVFFTNILNLLLTLSETLRLRIGQKEIVLEKKNYNNDNISRCSYKFCNFKDSCSYNYNKSKNLCYQDHYVHNMVSLDLRVLIEYIKQKYENILDDKNCLLYNKEILKTINTLSFVINHMENELKSKCMYLSEKEIESCHFIKKLT